MRRFSFMNSVTRRPLADPHYLNLLNHSWPSDRPVVSLISGHRHFTFLYGHTRHNIYKREGGRKEDKQSRTWVSSKCKKEKVVTLSQHSVLLWAIVSVYSSEIPTKSLGTQTHPLTLANPASGSTGPSSWLPPTSVSRCLLQTALFCQLVSYALLWDLAFPRSLPVSWEISCANPLC